MRTVYDIVVRTENKVGRCLSDLFLNLPARSLYPDYFQLIRNPICLRDIEERLPEYKNESNGSEHFIKDFILVFDNARVYNREYSMIYNDSLTLEVAPPPPPVVSDAKSWVRCLTVSVYFKRTFPSF